MFSVFHQIAGKVAAPLSRTNEIVILSGEGSRVTGEVNRLLAELPVSVNALTGVDLTKVRVLLFSTGVPVFHKNPLVFTFSLYYIIMLPSGCLNFLNKGPNSKQTLNPAP